MQNKSYVKLIVILVMALVVVYTVSGCSLLSGATSNPAAAWPERDITLVVPFKPGGGFDVTARIAAPFIEKYLPKKANVVVKNEPAASGKVGLQEVIDSKKDGYTIGVFDPVQLGTMQVLGDLGSTDMTKMTWLAQLDWAPGMMAIGKDGRFKTLQEMKGKEVKFSVTGQAGFSAVMIARALGATPKVITYDSSPDAGLAVMRGDTDATVFVWTTLNKQVNSSEGKLIAVMLAADKRDSHIQNVPTSKELGFSVDGSVLGAAHILAGPPDMPKELTDVMIAAMKKALDDPEYKAQMEKAGYPPLPMYGKELQDSVVSVAKIMEQNKDVISALQAK